MFLVLAAVWLYVLREPNPAFTEAERHALQVAGVVSAFVAVLFFILALRPKKQRHNDMSPDNQTGCKLPAPVSQD